MAADDDITAELEAAGKEFDKDAEIERILAAFRLNAYEVLQLQPGVPDSDIKKTYRQKSLLIHPDKTSNPRAPDAFDRLAHAQKDLLDEKKREILDEYIADARMLTMRDLKLTADDEEVKSEEFAKKWLEKQRWVIIDEEKRKQRQQAAAMREEGRMQRKEEEELKERKRKREQDDAWEKTRETRIQGWREFSQKGAGAAGAAGAEGGKKKKKKVKTLG